MRLLCRALFTATLITTLAASAAAEDDLKAAAAKTGVLSHMMAATDQAGLSGTGVKVGALTLFAPSDSAFEALPADFRAWLLAPENREHLVTLLLHHAARGEFPTERLLKARVKNYTVEAIDGSEIELWTSQGIDVEGAKIVQPDIRATNGIIHVIDKVLIPRSVLAAMAGETPATEIAVEGEQ